MLPPDRNTTVGACIFSLVTKVRVTTSAAFAWVIGVLFDPIWTLPTVGAVLSNVTLLASSTVVSAVPTIPARFVKAMLNVTVPLASALLAVYDVVHVFSSKLGLVGVFAPVIGLLPDWNVTTGGETMGSSETNVRIMVSLGFAWVFGVLSEATATVLSEGAVLSKVTVLESSTVVSAVPALLARSR